MNSASPSPRGRRKRYFDVLVSALAIVFLSPVMAATAVLILGTMGRPVLFTQVRPGIRAEPFRLRKFRTMRPGTADDAARLTQVGRFLRRTSIDELPQLWNVLRGEMSLVGPRPLLMEYVPRYNSRQARRHEVRPGLTGLAQVEGRNQLAWDQQLELDVRYVEEWRFTLDLRILWRSLLLVLSGRGISQSGRATRDKFSGSP